ncbi:MAG: hypothetical protein OXG35_19365 [Acidobacteria bacterium]|nr:hypothetical protein [Acidobacteriota bacterium]
MPKKPPTDAPPTTPEERLFRNVQQAYDITVTEVAPHVYSVAIPNRRIHRQVKALIAAKGPNYPGPRMFANAVQAVITAMHQDLHGRKIDTARNPVFDGTAEPGDGPDAFATLSLSNPDARQMIDQTSRDLQVSRALLMNRIAQAALSVQDTLNIDPRKVH